MFNWSCLFLYTFPSLWLMPICPNYYHFFFEKTEEKRKVQTGDVWEDMPPQKLKFFAIFKINSHDLVYTFVSISS